MHQNILADNAPAMVNGYRPLNRTKWLNYGGLDESTSYSVQRSLPPTTVSIAGFSDDDHNLSTANTEFLNGYEEISESSTFDAGAPFLESSYSEEILNRSFAQFPAEDNSTVKDDDDNQTIKDDDDASTIKAVNSLTAMNDEISLENNEQVSAQPDTYGFLKEFGWKDNLHTLFDKSKVLCNQETWKEIECVPIEFDNVPQEEYVDEEIYPEQIQPQIVRSVLITKDPRVTTSVIVQDDTVTKIYDYMPTKERHQMKPIFYASRTF
uniref:Uncharacterized protein n=1 Tax=Panagrolaimus sp. ES5 TaxID=591445 RepID=A0AC34FWU4_9BILA